MKASFASLIIAATILDNVASQVLVSPSQHGSKEFAKLTSIHSEPETQPQLNEELGLKKDTQVEFSNNAIKAIPSAEEDLKYADQSSTKLVENIYPAHQNKFDEDKLAAPENEFDDNKSPSTQKKYYDDEFSVPKNEVQDDDLPPFEESYDEDILSAPENEDDKLPAPENDDGKLPAPENDDGKLPAPENDEDDDDNDDNDDNDESNYFTGPIDDDEYVMSNSSYTTSTVYSTVTSTVTDCATTVTYCPEIGSVVTKTISLYTTVCPVTTTAPSIPLVTAPAIPKLPEVSYLTKTIESTIWYTVTDCSPTETDCPIGQETSSVATYYDVHPITGIFSQTAIDDAPLPTTIPSKPFTTGSPSGKPLQPQSNVTIPNVPLVTKFNAASIQKVDGLFMYFGLAFAGMAALFSQGWF